MYIPQGSNQSKVAYCEFHFLSFVFWFNMTVVVVVVVEVLSKGAMIE